MVYPIRLTENGTAAEFGCYTLTFPRTDTSVKLYTTYKISILLTDGLAAVLDGNIYNTVRGDILLFRPDEIHFGRVLRAGEHRYVDFYIPTDYFSAFLPDSTSLLFPLRDRGTDRINHIRLPEPERMRLAQSIENMIRIAESDDPAKEYLLFSGMIRFLSDCRIWYAEQKKAPVTGAAPAQLTKALQYINEYYTEAITLSDIAETAGCSVTYLTRITRQYTGKSLYGYLTECRLRCAENCLRAGASVTEACYRSGFGDCSNFIRTFRKKNVCTPAQFATSHLRLPQ